MTCLNPRSIINEEWNSDYKPCIYIELLNYYDTIYDGKRFCFRKDELISIMNIDNYQTSKWFIDPLYSDLGYVFNDDGWVIDPDDPEQKHPFGYPSDIERYIRIPIDDVLTLHVLQQNLETILCTDTIDYIGVIIDTTRVGTDYTMSASHGQLPEVTIYYLVPRIAYEKSPHIVANEIYNIMFRLKHSILPHPTFQDITDLQGTIAEIDRISFGLEQESPERLSTPIQVPVSVSERSRTPMQVSVSVSEQSQLNTPIQLLRLPSIRCPIRRSHIQSSRFNISTQSPQ
jgi:hypothetical protein